MTSSTRVKKQFSSSQSVSLLLLGILISAYETNLKLKHFQEFVIRTYLERESSNRLAPFGMGAHSLIFLRWDRHSSVIKSLRYEESVLCYLVLKVVGKKHCQFVFYEVAKTKHIPNTKVCGKRHTCL